MLKDKLLGIRIGRTVNDIIFRSQKKGGKIFQIRIIMLSAFNAFGASSRGGFGLLGDMGSTRGFAALNVVKVCIL